MHDKSELLEQVIYEYVRSPASVNNNNVEGSRTKGTYLSSPRPQEYLANGSVLPDAVQPHGKMRRTCATRQLSERYRGIRSSSPRVFRRTKSSRFSTELRVTASLRQFVFLRISDEVGWLRRYVAVLVGQRDRLGGGSKCAMTSRHLCPDNKAGSWRRCRHILGFNPGE